MNNTIKPYANLRGANLWGADLRGANLWGAHMEGADLRRANLWGADLRGAHMEGANLERAELKRADLRGAHMEGVNLEGANLRGANLWVTNLWGTNLRGTCLDPMTPPNGDVSEFEIVDNGQWCVGYRTKDSPHLCWPRYKVGALIEAPVFSTADTECHPGIFVCPTVEGAQRWGNEIVKVIFRPWECHHAGKKHRVKWLIVWDAMVSQSK